MRTVAILVALILGGCAYQEAARPKTITKTIYRDKIVEKVVYLCRPEPPGGCFSLGDQPTCDAHKRCQWIHGNGARSHCRKLPCRD
jgi:hypothetical protein